MSTTKFKFGILRNGGPLRSRSQDRRSSLSIVFTLLGHKAQIAGTRMSGDTSSATGWDTKPGNAGVVGLLPRPREYTKLVRIPRSQWKTGSQSREKLKTGPAGKPVQVVWSGQHHNWRRPRAECERGLFTSSQREKSSFHHHQQCTHRHRYQTREVHASQKGTDWRSDCEYLT